MEDSERRPLTGREKKIILAVLVLTLIFLGLWIFAITAVIPEPSHGLM